MQVRSGSKSPVKVDQSESQDNYDDDFDDDFDVEEGDDSLQVSNSKVITQKNHTAIDKTKTIKSETLVDFNVSASASLLPPLAGGNRQTALDQFQSNPS